MKKLLPLLAALAFLPSVGAATLAPAVDMRQPGAAPSYSSAAFDRAADTLPVRYEGHDAEAMYTTISQLTENAVAATPVTGALKPQDSVFAFAIDLEGSGDNLVRSYNKPERLLEIRYIMTGNQVTEGWNWGQGADPQTTDYYLYKFLPLKDYTVRKKADDVWKYEYMVTFANLYDFYPRTSDDDAGFVAHIPTAGDEAAKLIGSDGLRMLAVCRLAPPWHTQSSTFWKATDPAPYDFMLKKRYLYADLLEVWFYDYHSGKVLAKIKPLPK
jgi:hypothetical protein